MALSEYNVEDVFYGSSRTSVIKRSPQSGVFVYYIDAAGEFSDTLYVGHVLNTAGSGEFSDYVKTIGSGTILLSGAGEFQDFLLLDPVLQIKGEGAFSDTVTLIKIIHIEDEFYGKAHSLSNVIHNYMTVGAFRDYVTKHPRVNRGAAGEYRDYVSISPVLQLKGEGQFTDILLKHRILNLLHNEGKFSDEVTIINGNYNPVWEKITPHSPVKRWTKTSKP